MRRLYSWALILLLNSACTTTSTPVSVFHRFDELDMSREFTSQTIAGKPFILNVSNLESPQDALRLLQKEFQRVRPELQVNTPRLNATEEKNLRDILKRFAGQQELPADGYTFMQKSALVSSWFLIADVEEASTHQNVKEEDIKDQKGQRVDTKYSFISSRDVSVRYFIYDPAARHLVFSGLVRSTSEAIHDRVGGGDERDYPEFPSLEKALGQNFEKFVRALPSAQGH
ncbi:MAG TPA: hypothetical protein VFO10_02465 [Oligoflexus sp.]|uniref:hypothetical protein n=1 Tax=Oligoflexus sp. TaxID=1971216 RepID=UPI002D7F55C4|nr:hypothetical protein [Oligoflexus sp.]HET9236084.1 hypothetical protein [Oligoflexus sp.]